MNDRIRTQAGHQIHFDDEAKSITIETTGRSIVIDETSAQIKIESSGNVKIDVPPGSIELDGAEIRIESTGMVTIEAGGSISLKGATIKIN